ncbi:Uncharacterised protein [Acinetobacter baumannii]|nr:Uncharacterised protein [Acinetobacter baumannii]
MMLGRRQQDHIAEHIERPHHADPVQRVFMRFQHIALDKQRVALGATGADARRVNVESETAIRLMVFAPRHQDLAIEQRRRGVQRNAGIGNEARAAVRDHRIGHHLQIAALFERQRLHLRRVVIFHGVDLGRRLSGDMPAGPGGDLHLERQAIALQDAPRGGDDEYARHLRQRLVPIQRPLHQKRHAPLHLPQHAAMPVQREPQPQIAGFAYATAGHLRRLILIVGQLRRAGAELRHAPRRFADGRHTAADGAWVNRKSRMIMSTSSSMPSPVLQLVRI